MHILILHGIGGHAGSHWQEWLKTELEKKKHTVYMPDLPDSDHPKRFEWLRVIKDTTKGVPLTKLIIVGHSLGVVTALDFIEQAHEKVLGLVSVSGFIEDYGSDLNSYFMKEKEINFADVTKNLHEAHVLFGDDDPYVPQETLNSLSEWLHVYPKIIKNGGHLNTDRGYTRFPLLLEIIEILSK